ncbi:hypothetical protein ACU6TU_12395 [Halomonas sp. LS-001]
MKKTLSPWQVVTLESFQTPEQTQASQWRRSWRAATTWMVGQEASERQAKRESELRKLPEIALSHWVPAIDWTPAAETFNQAMEEFSEAPLIIFISPPHGGHEAVVSHWAEQQDVNCLPIPTFKDITTGCLDWVEHGRRQNDWAVPALERHFLRHSQGLQGVRELIERALSGRLGKGVIGCDSWAYAYLQQVVGLEGVPAVTLQALEGEHLASYFTHLATGEDYPAVYSTRTGKQVLASHNDSAADKTSETPHKELQRLSAHCRGHLGIAWHYWRERLREPAENGDREGPRESSQALWLLDALAEAELPADTGDVATLLLHTLLIHGGLDDQALGHVLPFSHHEALNARFSLARQGILRDYQGRWQVAPLSYASVRQLLESRHYLVDSL